MSTHQVRRRGAQTAVAVLTAVAGCVACRSCRVFVLPECVGARMLGDTLTRTATKKHIVIVIVTVFVVVMAIIIIVIVIVIVIVIC